MKSEEIFQIDTSSKKPSKVSQSNQKSSEKLTECDIFIQKIISENEDLDEHISAFELINNFKNYEKSIKKF